MSRPLKPLLATAFLFLLADPASAGWPRGQGVLPSLYLPPNEGGPSPMYSPIFSSMYGAPRSAGASPYLPTGRLFPPAASPTGIYPPQPVPRRSVPPRRFFRRR